MAGASGGDLDNGLTIEGGTDGTVIGNTSDRLKVDASVSLGSAPGDPVTWASVYLLDGSSFNMAVDGSSVQKVFSQAPGAGVIWYVKSVRLLIGDEGSMTMTNFGSEAGLTNGFDLVFERNSTNHIIVQDVKDNAGLALSFPDGDMRVANAGFGDDQDFYRGTLTFPEFITLDGDTSDEIRIEINDDLSGIDLFRSRIEYMRVLS